MICHVVICLLVKSGDVFPENQQPVPTLQQPNEELSVISLTSDLNLRQSLFEFWLKREASVFGVVTLDRILHTGGHRREQRYSLV